MTQVTIDISNDLPLLQDNVETLTEKLGDLTPLMQAIGSLLEGSTRQRFTDKKAPNGTSWANLMPSTQTQKGNNNILVAGDTLRESITNHADRYSVSVGTDMSYGVYHQFGTDPYTIRPKNKKALAFGGGVYKQVQHTGLPARPFLGLSDDDKAEIYELINEILMGD